MYAEIPLVQAEPIQPTQEMLFNKKFNFYGGYLSHIAHKQ